MFKIQSVYYQSGIDYSLLFSLLVGTHGNNFVIENWQDL